MAHLINQSIKNTFLSKRNKPIQEKLHTILALFTNRLRTRLLSNFTLHTP